MTSIKAIKETNSIWNREKMNSPFIWGNLSSLLQQGKPETEEEWKKFYFYSGEKRKLHLKRANPEIQEFCNDYEKRFRYREEKYSGIATVKRLNLDFGRTSSEVDAFILYTYNKFIKNWISLNLSLEEWTEIVNTHIFTETFNGYNREILVSRKLQDVFQEYSVEKVSGAMDFTYAIDLLIRKDNTPLLGIQVKPISYLNGLIKGVKYVNEAELANQLKQRKLLEKYGIKTSTVYSDKGEIGEEKIDEIKRRIMEKEKEIEKDKEGEKTEEKQTKEEKENEKGEE